MGWNNFVDSILSGLRVRWRLAKDAVLWVCSSHYDNGGIQTMSNPISMDDVGTRMQHLMELHDLWASGISILTRGTYHTEHENMVREELGICIQYLTSHMQKDFNRSEYAKEINSIGTTPPKD